MSDAVQVNLGCRLITDEEYQKLQAENARLKDLLRWLHGGIEHFLRDEQDRAQVEHLNKAIEAALEGK